MNKQAKKYYRNVYRAFPEHSKKEKQYLLEFRELIESIDCQSYDDYVEILGQPYDIARSYYKHIDYSLMIEKMKSQKIMKRVIIGLLTFIVLILMWMSYLRFVEYQMLQQDFYYTDTYIS